MLQANRVMVELIERGISDRSKRLFVHFITYTVRSSLNNPSLSASMKSLIISSLRLWLFGEYDQDNMKELLQLCERDGNDDDGHDNDSDSADGSIPDDNQIKKMQPSSQSPYPTSTDSTVNTPAQPIPAEHVFTQDGLIGALLLHDVDRVDASLLLSLLCNAIENNAPIPNKHPLTRFTQQKIFKKMSGNQTSRVLPLGMPSGYTEFHLTLWRSISNILGPISFHASSDITNRRLHLEKNGLAKHISPLHALRSVTHRDMVMHIDTDHTPNRGCPLVPGIFGENHMQLSSIFEFPNIRYCRDKPYIYVRVGREEVGARFDSEYEEEEDKEADEEDEEDASSSSVEDPSNTHLSHSGNAIDDEHLSKIIQEWRSKRKWWVSTGCVFSAAFLGEDFAWNVLECTAEVAVADAHFVHINSSSKDNTPLKQMCSVGVNPIEISRIVRNRKQKLSPSSNTSTNEHEPRCVRGVKVKQDPDLHDDESDGSSSDGVLMSATFNTRAAASLHIESSTWGTDSYGDEGVDMWRLLLDWCEVGDCCNDPGLLTLPDPTARQTPSSVGYVDTPLAINRFNLQKKEVPVASTSEFWQQWSKIVPRSDSVSRDVSQERSVIHELGDGILEILTFQVVVHCHLTMEQDSVFVARAVQIIVQHAMWEPLHSHRDVALRCVAYLKLMNIDVTRAVRVGNLLRAQGVQSRVAPMTVLPLPHEEQILHCSRGATSYDGI